MLNVFFPGINSERAREDLNFEDDDLLSQTFQFIQWFFFPLRNLSVQFNAI